MILPKLDNQAFNKMVDDYDRLYRQYLVDFQPEEQPKALVFENCLIEVPLVENKNLQGSLMLHCYFRNTRFIECGFSDLVEFCIFENCEFIDCNLGGSEINDSVLVGNRLLNCHLGKTEFVRCNLAHSDLNGSRLFYAYFSKCDLSYVDFTGVDFEGVRLVEVIMENIAKFDIQNADKAHVLSVFEHHHEQIVGKAKEGLDGIQHLLKE